MRNALFLCLALLAVALTAEQPSALQLKDPTPLPETASTAVLSDLDGNPVSLEDYEGRVVVLNFWATWCAPCRREMPSIGRLQATYDKDELIVLAVAVDRAAPGKLQHFMEETEASNLTILRDPTMAAMRGFELRGLPASIVLNTDGLQVARHDGYDEWDRPEIIDALNSLLPPS